MEAEGQGGEQLPRLCRYRLVLKGLGLTSYARGGLPVVLLRLEAFAGTLPQGLFHYIFYTSTRPKNLQWEALETAAGNVVQCLKVRCLTKRNDARK